MTDLFALSKAEYYRFATTTCSRAYAEPTEAVIVSIYEGLQPNQVAAIRNNRAAYAERHSYRQGPSS